MTTTKLEPKNKTKTITITDHDVFVAVAIFNKDERFATNAEALNKLVARAVRARLHAMGDAEFERFLELAIKHSS